MNPRPPTTPNPNSSPKKISSRFPKGVSGNPKGRPRGSRNRTTVMLEAMLEDGAEQIMQKLVAMAKRGDKVAMRLCINLLLPARRERPIAAELPEFAAATTASKKIDAILTALNDGRLLPSEAETLKDLVMAAMKAEESEELAQRVAALEHTVRELQREPYEPAA